MSAGAGNRRARAIAAGLVLVVALAFIVLSTWQVTEAVFWAAPARAQPETPAEAACVARLRTLEAALERAGAHATSAGAPARPSEDYSASEARARKAFDDGLAPEWNDAASAEQACGASARSREAWAALLRLRRGLEGRASKDAREIGPLRRDFETRLP